MTWLRVNRVIVSVWILSAPVCFFTSSRAADISALGSLTELRIRFGIADLVSRREALEHRVLAEYLDRGRHRRLGAELVGRRHQQLGDVGLQLCVGRAVFGVAEAAEQRLAGVDRDLLAAQIAVGDLVPMQHAQRSPHAADQSLVGGVVRALSREGVCGRTTSIRVRAPRRPWWWCSRLRGRRRRWPSARDVRPRGASTPAAARFRCRAV